MARIAGPMTPVPQFGLGNGVVVDVPVDLPEGGHLCVIVGQNPLGIPTPSVPIPPGSMIAILPPNVADAIRPVIAQAIEHMNRELAARRNGAVR